MSSAIARHLTTPTRHLLILILINPRMSPRAHTTLIPHPHYPLIPDYPHPTPLHLSRAHAGGSRPSAAAQPRPPRPPRPRRPHQGAHHPHHPGALHGSPRRPSPGPRGVPWPPAVRRARPERPQLPLPRRRPRSSSPRRRPQTRRQAADGAGRGPEALDGDAGVGAGNGAGQDERGD